jgi:pimeloyl-ACP methyl ester carboxylesterase
MKQLAVLIIMTLAASNIFAQTPYKSEVVTLNGTDIYYEVYGKGEPLFLLHGFTQSSKSWLPFVSEYSDDFEVYLVDLKGHGKSSPFTEKLSIRSVAIEVDALVGYLKLDNIQAIGFSYGGDVLFQLALLHPGLIKSMIVIGACGSWNANEFPEFVEYLSYKNIENLPWMREEQTSEEQIRTILNQVPNYIVSVNDEELKSIQAKTLLVVGDHDDSFDPGCVINAKKHIPDSFLWIVPNTSHSAHKYDNKENFIRVSKDFFKQGWAK